jgi:hypothetical protein
MASPWLGDGTTGTGSGWYPAVALGWAEGKGGWGFIFTLAFRFCFVAGKPLLGFVPILARRFVGIVIVIPSPSVASAANTVWVPALSWHALKCHRGTRATGYKAR